MSLIFVEANATGTTAEAMRRVKQQGFNVVLLTQEQSFYSGLGDNPMQIADEVVHVNTYEPASIARAALSFKPNAIIAFDDFHLIPAAVAASLIGLRHPNLRGLMNTRYKDLMRKGVSSLPGSVPSFAIDVHSDAQPKWSDIEFPIVLKPVDESGSEDVRVCHSVREAADFYERISKKSINRRGYTREKKLICERFIVGSEFSAELTWNDKCHDWELIAYIEKRLGSFPYCVEIEHRGPVTNEILNANLSDSVIKPWLKALGIVAGAVHVEFRIDDGSVARLIEENPRLAGGYITNLVLATTGNDMIGRYLKFHHNDVKIEDMTVNEDCYGAVSFLMSSDVRSIKTKERIESFVTQQPSYLSHALAPTGTSGIEGTSNYSRIGAVQYCHEDKNQVTFDLSELKNFLRDNRGTEEKV